MTWPAPKPGLVARRGREEGTKDRPCAVVLVVQEQSDRTRVAVLPITHTPPADPSTAVELPAETKQRLRLDAERSWVVISEYNVFFWPGPDLRIAPGKGPETVVYGPLPKAFTEFLIGRFVQRARNGKAKQTIRTE